MMNGWTSKILILLHVKGQRCDAVFYVNQAFSVDFKYLIQEAASLNMSHITNQSLTLAVAIWSNK